MRRIMGATCVVALLAVVNPVRADQDPDLRAIIDKAIKAHGGADNLAKYKATVTKTKGKFYGLGDSIDYTGEISTQLPDRVRTGVEVGGQKVFVRVVNGDKGWVTMANKTEELTKKALAEAKQEMNAAGIIRLVILKDKAYKLSTLGDVKIGDRQAVGVRVERKGFRDVSLFFDKEKGLLIKVETRGKDLMAGDKEFTAETFFDDFKKIDGMVVAHKIRINRDGKKYVESEATEIKFSEKLDDSVFAKP